MLLEKSPDPAQGSSTAWWLPLNVTVSVPPPMVPKVAMRWTERWAFAGKDTALHYAIRRAEQGQQWSPWSAKSPAITGQVCSSQSSLRWSQEVESAGWDQVGHGHTCSIAQARARAVGLSRNAALEQ